jgi:SpoVK/Ycf46/Vps4 family AAA+-type ATPase
MTHINGNDVNNNNNNNDVNNNNSIDNNTIKSENIIHKNAIHKKRIKQYFNTFVNLLDSRSDYYILNAYMNSAKRSLTTTAAATRYVAKNADHVPLPLPRDNPEKMYEKIDDTLEKIGMGESGENNKLEKNNDNTIDVVKVDIDCKNACYNKNCNGRLCTKIPFKIDKLNIDVEVKNIGDLIKMCNDYKLAENVEYNIDMKSLHKIKIDLIELDNMIGMKLLKENIVDQILYYLQNLHVPIVKSAASRSVSTGDFLHTVIYGSPGTGKTEVAKIIGRIYSNLGVIKGKHHSSSVSSSIDKKKPSSSSSSASASASSSSSLGSSSNSKSKFKKVTRSDLIAGYLGQTALKTRDVIKDSLGGVLFIDEAYALGNTEKRDSFSKECIDTLCEALSDNKENLMVIIAGYEKDLNECFFSYNDGLDSRFTWRFKIDDYSAEDLRNIFVKKVKDVGWSIDGELDVKWFEKNIKYFKYYGRDMETLFTKTKIAHSKRVFCKPDNLKTKITMKDLENGFEIFTKNDEVKRRATGDDIKIIQNMYL